MKRIALATAIALAPFAASAATPFDNVIEPVEGKEACFTRVYKPDHLKAHPKQQTQTITVWMKYEKAVPNEPALALHVSIGLTQRGDRAALFSQGGCDWVAKGANRDIQGKPVIKTFKKDAGAVCLMSARPDVFDSLSAEEGGAVVLDAGKDRNTMMVYLDDGLSMVKRANRAKQLSIEFGAEDRVFMLQRVEPESCTDVEDAVMTPEPGVKRR
jgi:hypothetical protein